MYYDIFNLTRTKHKKHRNQHIKTINNAQINQNHDFH